MKSILSAAAAVMAFSVSAAVDYYVAADGDDANDGLSPATAKATIAAGYTAMTNGTAEATVGNRLIVGDGEFQLPAFTIVLAEGQKIAAENAGRAVLKLDSTLDLETAAQIYANGIFALSSDTSALEGVSVDLSNVPLELNGALMQNPKGTISDCAFIRYMPDYNYMYGCNLVLIDDAAAAPVFRRCRFAGGKMPHIGSIIYVKAAASPIFDSCIFSDFVNPNGGAHTVGVIAVDNKDSATVIRNCLFVRCEVAWVNANAVVAQLIYTYRTAANKTLVENCSIVDCRVLGWENAKKKQEETGNSKYSVAMITGDATVRNTLVYGVRSSDGAEFVDGAETCANYSNSASDMTLVGTGNVQLEAGALVFAAPEEDDYTVLAGATVDGGEILDWMGAGSVDLRGEARVTGVKPDIGCFERKSEAKTYYVEKNGNDNNDGLSPETAKATIAGAYDAMTASAPQTEYADSIVVGDGVFELTGKTMKFSRRQKMSSVNGSGKTTLLVPSYIIEGTDEDRTDASYQLFDLASPNVEFKGFTVDFNNRLFSFVSGAFSVNPAGKILDCVFENCKSGRVKSVFFIQITAGVSPVFSNCVFRNIHTHYRSSVVYVNSAAAHPVFSHCKFQDLTCAQYFTYGTFHTAVGSATLRNCLFLRCQNHQDMHNGKYRSATIHGNATTYIENCSIIDCSFRGAAYESDDGLVWAELSGPIIKTASVVNTLVYGCTNHLGGAVNCRETSAYSYCAHDAKLDGENNILLSPGSLRFRKPFKGDYTVVSGPTVDAGVALGWMTGAKDLLGRARIIGTGPDIGCYEFDPKELLGMQVIFR